MALYAVECLACGHRFAVRVAASEHDQTKPWPPACPTCGTSTTQPVVPESGSEPPAAQSL